nr:serine/threonine-protein kinase pim-2-like [Labrus bergylta]
MFEFKYKEVAPIGTGGFGSVYSGIRKSDRFPVAIKHIDQKNVKRQQVMCNGKMYDIILEVALMLKAAGLQGDVGRSTAVSLLDWYTLDSELILMMEKPTPCNDLLKYLQASGGSLDEHEAKIILRQLVDEAIDMHSKNIFHRDLKPQEHHSSVVPIYAPPEWLDYRRYQACPTTVWQLGALFYSLLPGHGRFTTSDFINNKIKINKKLSRDCRILLHMCLTRDPMERATLEVKSSEESSSLQHLKVMTASQLKAGPLPWQQFLSAIRGDLFITAPTTTSPQAPDSFSLGPLYGLLGGVQTADQVTAL